MSMRPDPSPVAARRVASARPPLKVVPRGPRTGWSRRARRRMVVVGAALFSLAVVFGLVLVHVRLTTNEMRLTSLQSQLSQAQEQNLRLRLDVAKLESPARIVATAQQLGMVSPPSITYLTAVSAVSAVSAANSAGPASP